ncbi:MAG: 3'(2'),5'-bisphosphate nucleotidase CysQ, partial [Bacteroidota bacterium]
MSFINKLIEDLKQISIDAGNAIMEIYQDETKFGVTEKSDSSPLTLADQKSNQVICDGLEKVAPNIPIISEENKAIAYEERAQFSYAWLVDPMDGTKEFIKRNGEFTTNIALIKNGAIILGMVYVPVTEELFWAVKDEGAFMSIGKGEPQKLTAPSFTMKDKGLKVVCSRSHLNDATAQFIEQLDEPDQVSKGSSLKFLILAQGGAHVYPRLAPTMEWDTGAAQIILEEAGG